jgi:tripartite-type tricarboxylate transporter receptor subunit TctC
MKIARGIFAVLALALLSGPAPAQDAFPSKPVRFVVAFATGGVSDIVGRVVAQKWTETLGQQVVVENRAGAGGTIGTEYVAKSAPDGYTIVLSSPTQLAIAPALRKNVPYDPLKDFTPIGGIAFTPNILTINTALPFQNLGDLVAYAKANPGKLSFASAGLGSGAHIAGELFNHMAGVSILHVPYKGTGPAIADVMGGRVEILYGGVATLRSYVGSGKMRVLGVTSAKRSPGMPEVPTIAESGLPGYETNTWNSVVAPRGTPRPVIERLNAAIAAVLAEPDLRDRWSQQGIDADPGPPERLAAHIKAEIARFTGLVKATGLKLE